MLYHTPFLFICIPFPCTRAKRASESMLPSSAAAYSVHPVPLCMLMQNYSLCPTLGNILGCHLTLMQPAPIAKPLLEAAGAFLCVCVSICWPCLCFYHTHTLAGCSDCFYLFSWQSWIAWFFRRLLHMLTSLTSGIFLLVFHLVEIRLCPEGYASCNCLHYQL